MVRGGSDSFSDASAAGPLVVLSKVVRKALVLKGKVSHFRHHVFVLFRQLHLISHGIETEGGRPLHIPDSGCSASLA